MNERMQKTLKQNLRDGETVQWESGTLPFGLLDGKEGRKTLLKWILCAASYTAIIVFFAVNNAVTPKFLIILTALFGLMAITPILGYREVLAQRYFVTNERAILIKKDGRICTMNLDSINAVKLYPVKPGAALALGKSLLDEGDSQLRWRSTHAKEHPNSVGGLNALGLVFYNVEHAEKAMQLIQADK